MPLQLSTIESYTLKHSCIKKIDRFIEENSGKFFVGATHDPNEKLKEHLKGKNVFNIKILFPIGTREDTIAMERRIVEHYAGNPRMLDSHRESERVSDNENCLFVAACTDDKIPLYQKFLNREISRIA